MHYRQLVLLLVFALPASADQSIKAVFEALLSNAADRSPTDDEVSRSMNDAAIRSLSQADAAEIEKLAIRGLLDDRGRVQRVSIGFFLALTIHDGSSELIRPAVPALEVMGGRPGPFRRKALYVLGGTYPKPSDDALAFIAAQLQDKSLTPGEANTVTGDILQWSPSSVKQVASFARASRSGEVRSGVARQIGILALTEEAALTFLSDELDDSSEDARESAVLAIARLPLDARARFAQQIRDIVTNPNVSANLREAASRVRFDR